jgi:signal transduction histidine kinase
VKDDFVASVSHELRTPLTSIRGYLELVLDGEAGDLTDEQRQFLSIVDRNADRLLRVVGDLLFVAQVDAGKIAIERAPMDVDELVHQSVEAARPAASEQGVELDLEVDGLGPLNADRARLAQVIDNLVSNAVKFTPSGGRVEVRSAREGDLAVLEVTDTGIGISADDQDRLFQRFFRADEATQRAIQGTGLGLAIVQAIVEAHDGAISVASSPGAGTTFRVELPLERELVLA